MPEPREHMQHRGEFESILRKIPGFHGYLEKEYRRESDELQREWLANSLQRSKRGLDEYSRRLVDDAQLNAMPQVDRLRARLDKIIARIRGAMQGYSGMFDLVQIGEKELDAVYEHDVGLMSAVDDLSRTIEDLGAYASAATASVGPATVVSQLMEKIETIEQGWDAREDLLKGL